MSSIFISYRKQGADEAHSLHLAEDLRKALGESAVFRDVKGLGLGRFGDQLHDQVQSCKVMIALIGPVWIESIERLQNPQDWVRRELEGGLQRRILMVPLLLDGVDMPKALDLPASLRDLLEYHSVTINQGHWEDDVGGMINSLAHHLGVTLRETSGRGAVVTPNLSGRWIDTDGVEIKMEHREDTLQLWLMGPGGQPAGQGSGVLRGNQIQFNLQRPDYGYGTGSGTVSADGRQISGMIQYGEQRFGFSITRC